MANVTFADLILFAIIIVLLVMILCRYNKKPMPVYAKPQQKPIYNCPNAPQAAVDPDDEPTKGLNDGESLPTHFYERARESMDTRWLPDVYVQLEPGQVLPGQEARRQFGPELTANMDWNRAVDHSNQNPSLTGVITKGVDLSREKFT